MPRFELRVLGSPHILDATGAAVDLPLGKPLAALCYIALETTTVERGDLARILWPTSPEPRARASIRQALWLIRKHTDPGIVVEEGGGLSVDPEVLSTDLTAFEADLSAERLSAAFERWKGGPLEGFAVPDAPDWLHWADELRGRWETHLGRALDAAAESSSGAERVLWLERSTEVRPYRPDAWARLVDARVDLRDLEAADAALARLRAVADHDDQALVRKAEERVRLLRRSAFEDPAEPLVPEFVGRAGEFAELMAAWREAAAGRPSVVGIVGRAGIGKSALALEAVRHCESAGATAVEVGAVRAESGLEFGVLASLVSDLLRRPGAAGTSSASAHLLRSLVPSKGGDLPPTPPQPTALSDAVADLLAAVAHESPLVVLIEDAHWIDPPSALVVLRAVRGLRGAPLLLLWTCRTGEADNPGLATLRDAQDVARARRLELRPFSGAEVAEMLGLLLTGSDPDSVHRLAERIHGLTAGVPLHVVELLRDLRDRGALTTDRHGRWSLTDDSDAAVELPDSLAATQEDRIERLGPGARRVGAVLAEAPGPLTVESLQARSGLSPTDCTQAVAELFTRDLVRWTRDDEVALRHESLASALAWSAPGEFRSGRVWFRAAAVALVTLLAALGAWALGGDEPAAPPEGPAFGGGTLWLRAPGFAEGMRFDTPESWTTTHRVRVPSGVAAQAFAVPDADGGVILGGNTLTVDRVPPDAVIVVDGAVDTVLATPGEDIVRVVRPQGDAALLGVQHPDTSTFRMMLVRQSLGSRRDTAVLLSGSGSYFARKWSPDGRHIVATADNAVDSVLILEPGGRRLFALESPDPDLAFAVPCGDGRILGGSLPAGELARYWLWTFGDPGVVPWAASRGTSGNMVCSPDGSAVAYLDQTSDRTVLIVESLGGTVLVEEDLSGSGVQWLEWDPIPGDAPVAVEVAPTRIDLARGERDTLPVQLRAADDRPVERTVRWTADDPWVASVDELGIVAANRPGTTVVRATVDGWLSDSVRVSVAGDATDRLVLVDSFPRLDSATWSVEGLPVPVPVRLADGRSGLALTGDGFYSDRIVTREAFDLSAGATLEIRARFEAFTRRDRQRAQICLMEIMDTGGSTGSVEQQLCLLWPVGEGTDFDPESVLIFRAGFQVGKIPIPGLARPGEWTTLALQVEADGWVSAVVNGVIVGRHPVRLRLGEHHRFHATVGHAAVDTELLLSDLTLWSEARYR